MKGLSKGLKLNNTEKFSLTSICDFLEKSIQQRPELTVPELIEFMRWLLVQEGYEVE